LRRQTADADFAPLYRRLGDLSDIEPNGLLPSDRLIGPLP
jgi:hypothetical protein